LFPPTADCGLIEHCAALHKECPPQAAQRLESAWTKGLDAKSRSPQSVGCGLHGGSRLGRNRNQPIVFEIANREGAKFVAALLAQRHARTGGIAGILAAQDSKQQRHVFHGAGHGSDCAEN